ncbi:ankyrin repeat domain-containing protein [Leptospira noguchii]|uniref:ankyrin repeat domain-containing protein n=1 Tax=Leptospira noguchii TaxID=28182 RepID=UPI001FB82B54|nr:ankyrin repeat domain-containing protein [Leptospira noguchii]UOG33430.1 ankyrin repeat domain-containing protein [Leptospira noguchii]UOG44261.1 ankyrin repeat domain-containing protein [Leptospira noguchii]
MNPSELFEAIRKKNLTVMKKLLDEGCDPTSYEGDGDHNALSLAAYLKQPEMVEYLIQKGARVNDRTKGGRIALHNAVWQYDKRSVELLLEAGSDIHAADQSNWTPIWLTSNWEPFISLIERGAKVEGRDKEGETLLNKIALATASFSQEDGMKMLVKLIELGLKVSDEKPDSDGETLLMKTIERTSDKNKNQIAYWLIEQGINPLHVSHAGCTALHYACQSGDLDMVKTLVSLGADVNAVITQDGSGFEAGMSPLDCVTEYGSKRKAILSELKKNGASKKPAMKLEIENDVVRLKGKDRKTILENMLEITKNLQENVFSHSDYESPDHWLEWEFPGDEVDEADFFLKCIDEPELRLLVERYVSLILVANEREEDTIYMHEELEAGGYAMQALVTTGEAKYLDLLTQYIHSIDIDHTVHLHELMDVARSKYSQEQLAPIEDTLDELGLAR